MYLRTRICEQVCHRSLCACTRQQCACVHCSYKALQADMVAQASKSIRSGRRYRNYTLTKNSLVAATSSCRCTRTDHWQRCWRRRVLLYPRMETKSRKMLGKRVLARPYNLSLYHMSSCTGIGLYDMQVYVMRASLCPSQRSFCEYSAIPCDIYRFCYVGILSGFYHAPFLKSVFTLMPRLPRRSRNNLRA
jgi:hypothetical protein